MLSLVQSVTVALGLWGACAEASGIQVTWTDSKSVKEAASTIAYGLVKYYHGNNTGDVPGNLPDPYYWWHCGAMFGTLIDYWWLTGDETYNDIVFQGMTHQVGEHKDYMPTNQTRSMGNDDQGFWAMAAMSAAEKKFKDPEDDVASWVGLVQAVFNEYVTRWETETCDGGLRWQVFQFNTGFNYKNSISNGCFFNIASRLARYTGNSTYSDWATKIWKWEQDRGLITDTYQIMDGVTIKTDDSCNQIDQGQWTYNAGIFLHGAAVMYNITEKDEWKKSVNGIIENSKKRFFKNDIMYEPHCEEGKNCNFDQQCFKGFFSRWLAETTQMASFTKKTIGDILKKDAEEAVKVCTGPADGQAFKGIDGTACGFSWLQDTYDDTVGVGSQMNALSAVMYTLVDTAVPAVTNSTGGTSKEVENAGNVNSAKTQAESYEPITIADKVGAGIITALALSGVIGGSAFVIV